MRTSDGSLRGTGFQPVYAVLFIAACATTPASANLIFDAPLSDGEGDTAAELVGRTGALSNAVWVDETCGPAVEFNGTSTSLTFPGDNALSPAHALTVSAWVKCYSRQPSLQRVVQRASGTWGLYLSNGNLTFYATTDAEPEGWRSVSGEGIVGEWCHACGVYDGEQMTLYLNGRAIGQAPQTGVLKPASPDLPLKLGHDSGDQTLSGALSQVRIWDEALDGAAVAAEYSGNARRYLPRDPFPVAPVLHLPFDEGQGDVAADQSITKNNAHVQGDWADGHLGTALAPTAPGGASVGSSEPLNLADAVTVEAWVRQDAATREMQRVAFRSSAYGLYTTGDPSSMTWYVNAGGEWSSVRAPLPQGRWVRVTGTYDGANLRLYYDGEEAASAPKVGMLAPNSSPMRIGHGGGATDMPFQGAIDEVFVVGEAVTDFPERRSATVENPDSVPLEVVPYVADELGGLPSVQVGRMEAPTLDGTVDPREWAAAARLDLREATSGQSPRDATVVRAGYDDAALYVSYVCAESDVEGMQFVQKVSERDGAVWNDDCAEVLIQPDPADEAYYHFVVSAAGVIYDAKVNDKSWDSSAVAKAVTDEAGRKWTLELSIPWADLGSDGPPTGSEWRVNLCREQYPQKELQAWSPTRSFHQRERFGQVAWADVSRSVQAGKVTVYGRIMRDGGERVAGGVTVRIGDRLAMTRADGVFKLAGVPEGEAVLKLEPSPLYHPVAVTFTAAAPTTIAIPPSLERVDLQAHAFELPAETPFRVLPVAIFEEPPVGGDAPAFPAAPELSLTAARSEYEPVSIAVYAAADIPALQVSVSDLTSGDGAIAAGQIDVRMAARTVQRRWYTSPINDAVVRTRYLLPYKPEGLKAGQFRQLWLTLHVPDDAPGGDYAGSVTLSGAGQSVDVPFSAHVVPVTLQQNPEKRYGAYYRGLDYEGFTELYRYELPDMREHGCDYALWRARIGFALEDGNIEVSYTEVERQIEILREYGFRPPWTIWSGLERLTSLLESAGTPELIEPEAQEAIQGLVALAEERGWGEIHLTHMDEVFNQNRLPRYIELTKLIRSAGDVTVYQTIRADAPEMMREADPYIDVRCYNGHNMDEWVSAGHSFDELAAELEAAGDDAWVYYNPRSVDVTPEWTRISNGLYMWLTPFKLHTPWIYNSYGSDPFDAEDGHDFGYAFPSPEDGGPVPTRLWEAFREGVDDLRYIYTLEQLIAANEGDAKAVAAQEYLDSLRARLQGVKLKKEPSAVVKAWSEELGPEDWVEIRTSLAEHIEALSR